MSRAKAIWGLLAAACLCGLLLSTSARQAGPADRTLEIVETVRVDIPAGVGKLRLWVPRLAEDAFQTAELLDVKAPWPHDATREPEFGNSLFYFDVHNPVVGEAKLEFKYRVHRREQDAPVRDAVFIGYTQARGLVVIDDEVRRIARRATARVTGAREKARALYDYVLSRMDYDTTGSGWGRGDVVYACRVGKGNCTDFHSLFIALARAEGIPARFKMGYPLPKTAAGPIIKPYHCWAEFHIPEEGWLPVDISEAWKHPTRADDYFGRLDADRVLVSTGRELRLIPAQSGKPLNYFVRPYVEVDGKPLQAARVRRIYKDIGKGETRT